MSEFVEVVEKLESLLMNGALSDYDGAYLIIDDCAKEAEEPFKSYLMLFKSKISELKIKDDEHWTKAQRLDDPSVYSLYLLDTNPAEVKKLFSEFKDAKISYGAFEKLKKVMSEAGIDPDKVDYSMLSKVMDEYNSLMSRLKKDGLQLDAIVGSNKDAEDIQDGDVFSDNPFEAYVKRYGVPEKFNESLANLIYTLREKKGYTPSQQKAMAEDAGIKYNTSVFSRYSSRKWDEAKKLQWFGNMKKSTTPEDYLCKYVARYGKSKSDKVDFVLAKIYCDLKHKHGYELRDICKMSEEAGLSYSKKEIDLCTSQTGGEQSLKKRKHEKSKQ